MARVVEDTAGKIRDLPISTALRALLLSAAERSGVDTVRVISGGQCAKGTCTKRKGSERHDNGQAADLQLIVGGRSLKFTEPAGLTVFETFVTASAAAGATGLGAGIGYMGADTIHVGFGSRLVWGAGGKSANAPQWLIRAARAGWRESGFVGELNEDVPLDSADDEAEEDQVQSGPCEPQP